MLLPQAAGARPELRAELSRRGWDVDAVEAYRTVAQKVEPALLAAASVVDALCFASSSAVNSYLDQAGTAPLPPVVACIGPVTAATARARGLQVHAEASEHTLDGLVAALVRALNRVSGGSAPCRSPRSTATTRPPSSATTLSTYLATAGSWLTTRADLSSAAVQ